MEFVSWDDDIPNHMGKEKMFQTTKQMGFELTNKKMQFIHDQRGGAPTETLHFTSKDMCAPENGA